MAEFDIDRFIGLSGAVRTDDLDWEEASRIGLSDDEATVLRYMADTETHTIVYMRDLLAGHSTRDPEVTSFLSVWVYEELWHGRAIDMLLEASGREVDRSRPAEVVDRMSMRETVERVLSGLAAWSTADFIATHMTWGAVNELTAAAAYQALGRKTKNPVCKELCRRMAQQERKHFAFYFQQADKRLRRSGLARAIARFAMRRMWTPVGSGVGGQENLLLTSAYLFSDAEGRAALEEGELRIRSLPGLEDFDGLTTQVGGLVDARVAMLEGVVDGGSWETQQRRTA